MTLAQNQALTRMKVTGITVVHQVLDNECSALYKKAIADSGMTSKQVSTDKHQNQLSQMSSPNEENSLHCCSQLNNKGVSNASLGPSYARSRAPIVIAETVKYKPKNNSICLPIWSSQLQCQTIPPHYHRHACPQKNSKSNTFAQHCVEFWVLGTSMEHY